MEKVKRKTEAKPAALLSGPSMRIVISSLGRP